MRVSLLDYGLFPETLPPCFSSSDSRRAFRGLTSLLRDREFKPGRHATAIPYNGTKHDGNRRIYATPHVVPYSHIAEFIGRNWITINKCYARSKFSISTPTPADVSETRAIKITPLSDVSRHVSEKIRYSPYILRADVAQFYPSIYTHTISWAIHGKVNAKNDRRNNSKTTRFNRLDFFVRNTQEGQTKGILIGPDAFRIIAEFIACRIDQDLSRRCRSLIVGAARYVDDYYIGIRSAADAPIVLSHLRDALYEYQLQLNDLKTAILPGVSPLDDAWAARLRFSSELLQSNLQQERIVSFFDEAVSLSQTMGTQSPVKLAVRRADRLRLYQDPWFEQIEAYLQRMLHHFAHTIDYICLFIAKRRAIGGSIDLPTWNDAVNTELLKHLQLGHHHEACWLLWLAVVCDLKIARSTLNAIPDGQNIHLMAILIQAISENRFHDAPRMRFQGQLTSADQFWLPNLVAKSVGQTTAPFSGVFAEECEHLARKKIRLIDFESHSRRVAGRDVDAISSARFGYDHDEGEIDGIEDDAEPPWGDNPF